MLTYHPAFDTYHCVYRTLLLTTKLTTSSIEVERMRIWDFYFVFPQEIKNISFPQELLLLKRTFRFAPNPYEGIVDPHRIFERMKPFQLAALNYLAAYGFIESEELTKHFIKRTDKPIPQELLAHMNQLDEPQKYVIDLVQSPLNNLSLYGDRGLKYRTKVLDFKYDPN